MLISVEGINHYNFEISRICDSIATFEETMHGLTLNFMFMVYFKSMRSTRAIHAQTPH
jgi:hypothetical protein